MWKTPFYLACVLIVFLKFFLIVYGLKCGNLWITICITKFNLSFYLNVKWFVSTLLLTEHKAWVFWVWIKTLSSSVFKNRESFLLFQHSHHELNIYLNTRWAFGFYQNTPACPVFWNIFCIYASSALLYLWYVSAALPNFHQNVSKMSIKCLQNLIHTLWNVDFKGICFHFVTGVATSYRNGFRSSEWLQRVERAQHSCGENFCVFPQQSTSGPRGK